MQKITNSCSIPTYKMSASGVSNAGDTAALFGSNACVKTCGMEQMVDAIQVDSVIYGLFREY